MAFTLGFYHQGGSYWGCCLFVASLDLRLLYFHYFTVLSHLLLIIDLNTMYI